MIDWIKEVVSFIMHIDVHLDGIIRQYGAWSYGILALIIFVETGLVIMPFLPGDSLLFAAGAFAAKGSFNVLLLFVLLCAAAIVGDSVNYLIGKRVGSNATSIPGIKLKHLERTHAFYEKHGGKTIIIARFMPIIRTFAPFVAGVGAMDYPRFLMFNVVGGVLWVGLLLFAGYFFGRIPAVENNFTIVIMVIIGLSILPPIVEYIRHRGRAPEES
ncbi:MAG TPA: DedA family protein [Longimicrobiales bacterium]